MSKDTAKDSAKAANGNGEDADNERPKRLPRAEYEPELERLQRELIKLQAWVQHEGLRLCVVFEGRDTAGKGGVIKRIVERTNPRIVRVAALPKPTDRERTEWYFQRYVAHLPAGGEIVLFDRSWYNRAGVERVMGFCTEDEYLTFLRTCPLFEEMLLSEGIVLVKYWLTVGAEEQERRFRDRIEDPTKRWKLSPMDLESRPRWLDFARAKDDMFEHTDTDRSPWWVVPADDKRRARLNCIAHLLEQVPYGDLTSDPITLPPLQKGSYERPPMDSQRFVPQRY